MVKEAFKSVLQAKIAVLSKRYGIPEMPEVCRHALEVEYEEPVEYYLDMDELDTCALTIPSNYAVKHWDEISKVAAGLANVKGVTSIDDFCKKEWVVDGEAREIEIKVEAKYWEKSQDELDAELYANAEAGDPDAIAELKRRDAAEHAERAKHWKEFILPIPAPSKTRPTELYLTMAYEPYDLIKSGEKVTEFREYCETWVKRILANMGTLRTVRFQRGYGGPGRPKPEQMIWTIKNIDLYDIEMRESCDPMNVREGFVATHIAIDLGERCDKITPKDLGGWKFRFIIPVDEKEQGEPGFYFDRESCNRASDPNGKRLRFTAMESSLLLCIESSLNRRQALIDELTAAPSYPFPAIATIQECAIAYKIATSMANDHWSHADCSAAIKQAGIQNTIEGLIEEYFEMPPINPTSSTLQKHFGYLW